jgi:hypothetical protein
VHKKYAKGSIAVGFCDRCGFEYLLDELKVQITDKKATAVLVCKQCLDSDNPQLQLGRIPLSPNEVIVKPSPDQALDSSRDMTVTLDDKTVSFAASSVNTINDLTPTGTDETLFRTSKFSIFPPDKYHRALVRTTNSQFDSLANDEGIAGLGFDLVISSATLKVGADVLGQQYTNFPVVDSGCYRVIKEYDPSSVTWNSFGSGGSSGTDYTPTGLVAGVVGSYYVEWDLTDMVKDWITGKTENYGVFFPDTGTQIYKWETDSENVVWTITAKRKLF